MNRFITLLSRWFWLGAAVISLLLPILIWKRKPSADRT